MTPRNLNPKLAVRPQVHPHEIERIAADGFRAIVNNRPDGEAPGQPSSEQLEVEAMRHGLAYWYIPVVPGEATEADARAFARALDEADGPVLAFCRTGNRSTQLARMAGITD